MSTTSKTVLITGSTRGIGLTFAQHYIKAGWKVISTARASSNTDKLKALAPFKIITMDTADEASIVEAAKQLEGEPIDLLINNAGIGLSTPLATLTKDAMMKQFEVNTVGPLLVTRALLPNLELAAKTNGQATVIQLSSLVGSIAFNMSDTAGMLGPHYGYCASKTALNMVNVSLARDLRESKVAAMGVHPGYVNTDMTKGMGTDDVVESVAAVTKVIEKVTMAESGKFFNYDGSELAW